MFNIERMMKRVNELLKKPFWLIDIIPEQVKQTEPGQYLKVESFYLKDKELRKKQLNVLLKLNCYYDFIVWIDQEPVKNPSPNKLKELIGKTHLNIEVEDALIMIESSRTYMTIFNTDGRILDLVRQIITAEGLFMWQPTM